LRVFERASLLVGIRACEKRDVVQTYPLVGDVGVVTRSAENVFAAASAQQGR
jgi:hypothetical protein